MKKVQQIVREVLGPDFWERGYSVCYNDASHAPTLNTTKRRFKFQRVNVTKHGCLAKEKAIKNALVKEGYQGVGVGIFKNEVFVYTVEDMIRGK